MVRRPSVVRPSSSASFKAFLLQNRWANQNQISYGASVGWGTKVCSRGLGHMNKMAETLYMYGKFLQKSSSPEPNCQWPCGLVFSIGALGPSQFVQMMTVGWPWPILRQCQILVSYDFIWGKTVRKSFKGENYSKWPVWQKVCGYIKILTPRGCLPLPWGYIYV